MTTQAEKTPHAATFAVGAELDNPSVMPLADMQAATVDPPELAKLGLQVAHLLTLVRTATKQEQFADNKHALAHLSKIRSSAGRMQRALASVEQAYDQLGDAMNHLLASDFNGTEGAETNAERPPAGRLNTGLRGFLAGVPQPEDPPAPGAA